MIIYISLTFRFPLHTNTMTQSNNLPCAECGALCCRHIALEIDTPTCKTDYDNIRWYLMHKDVSVCQEHDKSWILIFKTPCTRLGKDNTCTQYNDRPNICRKYPNNDLCEYQTNESAYLLEFSTAKEFEAYLNKKNIDWRFKHHT